MQTWGSEGSKAKEGANTSLSMESFWDDPFLQFCLCFQNTDSFSESIAFVTGPITGVVLLIIHSFCLGCICLRQISSAMKATVRAEIALQIGEIKVSRFSRCRILSFFLFFFSQVCSELLYLADCSAPCHETECSSKAPHWPACFVSLFWALVSKNWCSGVWALNKKETEFPVNLCLISVSVSWCQYSYSYLFSV